jgi:hypothetical protein
MHTVPTFLHASPSFPSSTPLSLQQYAAHSNRRRRRGDFYGVHALLSNGFLLICVQMGFLLFVLNETPNFKYSLSFGISIYCCKHCFDSDYCLMLSCDLEYAYSRRCVLMQLQVSSYSCDLEYAYSRCCVLIQLQVSSYCCICVLILLYVSSYCYTSSVLIYILSKLE